jgi:putative oxidoreductase
MRVHVGLLILRLVLGSVFIGHGTQKLFGWFGGHGLKGTGSFIETQGYRPGVPLALFAGLAEAGGGSLLVLGLLTPLGSAAIVGMMLNAILSVHLKNGFWNANGGFEFNLVNAAAATALAFIGPGRYSLDNAFGLSLSGVAYGLGALVLGVGVGLLIFGWKTVQSRRLTLPEARAARRAA